MKRVISILCLLSVLLPPALALAETVTMTSLDWPPYTGETLPGKGASTGIAAAAFKAAGFAFAVEFYPWKRAVQTGKMDGYAGYFPEYLSDDIGKEFDFSEPMGTSPLGFIESVDKPIPWTTLADLKGRVIGVVSGYVNTAKFDAKAAAGELTIEEVVNDAANIK